ncbi:ATP-binding protein [Streptomyces sp. NPDC002446]
MRSIAGGAEPSRRSVRTSGTEAEAWPLPHRPEAVREARRIVAETLRRWQASQETTDRAVLVVSELITNAVEHATPPLTLRLSRAERTAEIRIHIEVTDGGPAATEGDWTASCTAAERGRGLTIIDRVANAHGDRWQTGRASHWADLTAAA